MGDFLLGLLIGIGAIFAVFALALIVGLIVAWPILLIWNYLMPDIFGLVEISYWQAFWIYFLANLLTKGSGYSSTSSRS
jgi:hypothetical protein